MNCRAVDSREKYEKFKRQKTVKMFTQGDLTFTGLDSGSTELIRQGSGMQESYFEATDISDSLCDFNSARDSSPSPTPCKFISFPFRILSAELQSLSPRQASLFTFPTSRGALSNTEHAAVWLKTCSQLLLDVSLFSPFHRGARLSVVIKIPQLCVTVGREVTCVEEKDGL